MSKPGGAGFSRNSSRTSRLARLRSTASPSFFVAALLSWNLYEKHFLKLKRFFPMGHKSAAHRQSPGTQLQQHAATDQVVTPHRECRSSQHRAARAEQRWDPAVLNRVIEKESAGGEQREHPDDE